MINHRSFFPDYHLRRLKTESKSMYPALTSSTLPVPSSPSAVPILPLNFRIKILTDRFQSFDPSAPGFSNKMLDRKFFWAFVLSMFFLPKQDYTIPGIIFKSKFLIGYFYPKKLFLRRFFPFFFLNSDSRPTPLFNWFSRFSKSGFFHFFIFCFFIPFTTPSRLIP